MKKTAWKIVLLTTLILLVALALAACGGVVKFKLNFIVDGKVYDTVDTAGQEAIALPENPTKEGDEFDGWYWDTGEWNKPFTANSLLDAPLSSDMNVYAKWKSDAKKTPEATTGVINDPSAAELINATGFTVNGNALSMVLPNATESYSFLGQITVSPKATWQISTDIYGVNSIPTKTVPLNVGDNTFYLLITSENGEGIALYTVTIRRRPIYTVTFNANGGNSVTAMRAEEDSTITPPSTTRTGYTFAGWDYDFTQPIKGNLTTAAKWTSNTDTSYTVEYYLQNKGATGYDLAERVPLTGTTASTVTAEQKTYPHFTYESSGSTKTGTVAPDGSLVLKLYYTRDTYTVTFVGNGGTLASGKATQTVRYGNAATIPTFTRKGYTLSWDKESNAVAEDLTVTAQWSIDTYTVSYDVNGGEAIANPAAYRITDDAPLAEPTWAYGRFLGWYTASDEKITNLQGYAGDLSLTAKWECYFTLNGNTITGVSYYCKQNVTEIVIPASLNGTTITSIGDYAFDDCTGLKSVTIGNGVTGIGNYAFSYCTGLTAVTIGNGVKSIGDYAFRGCTGLKSVTIGNCVTSIGRGAFIGCTRLTTITVGEKNPLYHSAGNCLIGTESKTLIAGCKNSVIPSDGSVTSIGASAFGGCSGLTSITIPDSVTSIGDYAFSNCTGLTSVTIGNGVTRIGERTFSQCTGLTKVTIGNSVTSIGKGAFYYCSGLTKVTIGDGVTSIGEYAFGGCSALQSITIPFVGGSIKTASDTYQYPFGYIFGTSSYTGGVATEQYYYGSSTSYTTNTTYYIPSSLKSVTVTGGNILSCAFSYCTGLTSVTIGNGVTSIGKLAFYNCSGLTSVTFKNVSGWYVTKTQGASNGTNVTLTDSSTNATNLKSTYNSYYWYRK